MGEIQPGPELDAAVAKAIGWKRACKWESQHLKSPANSLACPAS